MYHDWGNGTERKPFPGVSTKAREISEVLMGKCSMFLESYNGESVHEVVREDAVVCGWCLNKSTVRTGQPLSYHASE